MGSKLTHEGVSRGSGYERKEVMEAVTLQESIKFIRDNKLAESVKELNYHVMLGGSILYCGVSDKDLDLFFSPLNGYEGDCHKLFDLLNKLFGPLRSIRDSPDYHVDALFHWKGAQSGTFNGKRVDLFWR